MSLVDEWIASLSRLSDELDRRASAAAGTQAGSSQWERDAALQMRAGTR